MLFVSYRGRIQGRRCQAATLTLNSKFKKVYFLDTEISYFILDLFFSEISNTYRLLTSTLEF